MGAGLLSRGKKDPWLPQAGWYIVGAGTYVKGTGYPNWGSDKVDISDKEDYFEVGTGRRMRRHALVAILAKPCNDRGDCKDNTKDDQFRCYNRQIKDKDLEKQKDDSGNLWGIAGGGFDFTNWPAKTRSIMKGENV